MKSKTIAVIAALLLACVFAGCQMDVNEAPRPVIFVEPYITGQPASISYYPGEYTSPPELTVVSEGWESGDGALEYQWYTFPGIGAYVRDGGTPIDGATGDSYTPTAAQMKTAPGSRNYFYVEVTNTNNSATNQKTGTIRSNVAVISFNETGKQAIPLLEHQAPDAEARFAASLNPLLVRVDTSGTGSAAVNGDNLLYQWYRVLRNDDGEFEVALNGMPASVEKIEGETGPWYAPDTSKLLPDTDHYFYVVVTHHTGLTPDGQFLSPTTVAEEAGVPVKVHILRGLRAAVPTITVQPKSALYFGSATPTALTVTATSPDGELSYQWYSNTVLATSTGNPQLIQGATEKTYTPLATDAGSFYFVEVTNTNLNVVAGGATTATVHSRAVNVRLGATAADETSNAQLTLRPDIEYQYVRGYGGMEVAWANFPETTPDDTELMYNPDKLGYNILRIMLPLFEINIDKSMERMVRERRKYYYDNVKIVNKYGGYVAAAPWSPPKEWKSNNSINGGGRLQYEYYQQYATYLRAFAQHMYNRGAPIYCISIQNEPNYTAGYDGCEWTGAEMRNFFKQVGRFTEGVRGYGGGRTIPTVLTMNGESANNPNINTPAIDDPDAYKHIDVFARHVYGERRENMWNLRPNVQKVDKKEVWMTEHNINSANPTAYPNDSTWNYIWRFMNDIDLVMRLNNENAFVWWASKRFYSMVGDGQANAEAGAAMPRGWGLSHYSKYTIDTTRIGFDLAGTTANTSQQINYTKMADGRDSDSNTVVNGAANDMDNTTARITAYISQDGSEISMVMWTPTLPGGSGGINMGTIEIAMPDGFLISSATGIQSQRGSNPNVKCSPHETYNPPVSSDRTKAYVTLPASRIISVKFTRQ